MDDATGPLRSFDSTAGQEEFSQDSIPSPEHVTDNQEASMEHPPVEEPLHEEIMSEMASESSVEEPAVEEPISEGPAAEEAAPDHTSEPASPKETIPDSALTTRQSKRRSIKMDVTVDAHGAQDLTITKHAAGSDGARRLLKARVGVYPDTGSNDYNYANTATTADANVGPDRDFNDVRGGALWNNEVTAITFRIPHDGDPTTNSQIITLHGRATDPDSWSDTASSPNDPYSPHMHDPYSGTSGSDSLDGPRAGAQNEGPGDSFQHESLFAEWNAASGQTNPRGNHDPLKISWQCDAGANNQKAPAVAPYDTMGHAQGYRKSTGQRTQGNDVFFGDERASCSTTPDVTGFKPACLVHAYDQPPATRWGAHALQDGPAITLTLEGATRKWQPSGTYTAQNEEHVCTMTATDPYGNTNSMTVTITVQPEENSKPVPSWGGGATTYTVPHDHSPETHHVQVLLDGEYSDSDNSNHNIGPLGNTATETTSMSIQEQLNWQFAEDDKSTDGFDGIFVGNAPAQKFVGTGYCKDGSYSTKKEYTGVSDLRYCQDACSDWPECHTVWFDATNSVCRMYNNCQNNDPTMIEGTAGQRYTKEVNLGTSWAMFRGRPRSYQDYEHDRRGWQTNDLNALHSHYAWQDLVHGHGNDTVTFLWTCPDAGGHFFEKTLGNCRGGNSQETAFEQTGYSGFCEKTDIPGDARDYCEDLCMRTTGCSAFEIKNVEFRGVCTEASGCNANTCRMYMGGSNAAPTCPTDWTSNGGTSSDTSLHGDGALASHCYTKKQGQAFNVLKPVVSLPGPEWTLHSTGAWSEPGGQIGQTSSGTQWAAASKAHTCTLRVTDSYGATATMTQTITINREPNVLPVANAGADQTYTVPHDFYPTAETNHVLVTLYGGSTADSDKDKLKHDWKCVSSGTQTAWATVELPFPVQLGGINTGFREDWRGGLQTGAGDPEYIESGSATTGSDAAVQMSDGWGADLGHSGDGDTFEGTHSHQKNEVTVMLGPGTHTCTLTTTDTYNEAHSDTVTVTVNAEPNSDPNSA